MEHEEEGKVTTKMIPDLANIPKWKDHGHNTMSKHFKDLRRIFLGTMGSMDSP
jgi:hypothetical protein